MVHVDWSNNGTREGSVGQHVRPVAHFRGGREHVRVSFRLLPIRKSTLPIEGQAIRIWQKICRKFTPRVCFHEREIFPIGGPIRS